MAPPWARFDDVSTGETRSLRGWREARLVVGQCAGGRLEVAVGPTPAGGS